MSFWKLLRTDRIPPGVQQQLSIFPWYDGSQLNDPGPTASPAGSPRMELGQFWYDEGTGNVFMYVKAAAGLVIGQMVALQTAATDTVTAAGSTTDTINLGGAYTANGEVGNIVNFINISTTTVIASRFIKKNGTGSVSVSLKSSNVGNNVFDADLLPSVPANGSAVAITRPWNVIVCTASTVPVGVAMGTVTSGNFTIIQVAGYAQVLGVGSVTALVSGQPAIPGAGGTITGTPNQVTATPLNNLFAAAGVIVPQVPYAGASTLVPAYVNFLGY